MGASWAINTGYLPRLPISICRELGILFNKPCWTRPIHLWVDLNCQHTGSQVPRLCDSNHRRPPFFLFHKQKQRDVKNKEQRQRNKNRRYFWSLLEFCYFCSLDDYHEAPLSCTVCPFFLIINRSFPLTILSQLAMFGCPECLEIFNNFDILRTKFGSFFLENSTITGLRGTHDSQGDKGS